MDNKYEIKKYDQKEFLPSSYVEFLQDRQREEVHLRDYLNIILKRKSMVFIFLICVVIITIILSMMMTPLYNATTVIKIDKESPNVLSFQGVAIDSPGADYYQTQFEILKSRNLAERVIKELNLNHNKDFLPPRDMMSRAKKFLFDNTVGVFLNIFSLFTVKNSPKEQSVKAVNTQPANPEIPDYMIGSLISRIQVTPVKNSQLVKVSFVSHNPELSMNVANAIARTYITFDLESRILASQEAKTFLESQLELSKQKVEESEKKLNAFASQKGIVLNASKESLMTQTVTDTSSALNAATTERLQKEALYREVKESGSNNPVILNNPLIQGLKREFSSLEAEYYNLLRTYTPEYPKMKNLKSQMDALQNRIAQENAKIVSSVESDYRAALKKEENLSKAFNAQKNKVLSFQDTAAQYEVFRREVEVNKGLYNNLLQRLNEVSVSASNKATNIQVLDKAIYPKWPFKPNLFFNVLLSIIFGLAGGIGLAFLADYFDNSIKDTDDIEKKIDLPTLGVIPVIESPKEPSGAKVIPLRREPQTHLPVVIADRNASPVIEAFRSIGAFILLSTAAKPPKAILVTGPGEKAGKTSICINIAKALIESLGRGIIIDGDLRKPKLHSAFELENAIGLSSFLSGNVDFDVTDGRLVKSSQIAGLSVMTAGPVPPNPSELLGSSRMQDLIYALQPLYDFIIIDSPPVMGLPDAIYLSKIVDGTVFVVKAGETPLKALKETKRVFRDINARILGVVLNGVKKSDLRYGTYNYYHSAYYSSYFNEQQK